MLPQDVGAVLTLRAHKASPKLTLPLGSLRPDAWFCRRFQLEWLPGLHSASHAISGWKGRGTWCCEREQVRRPKN